MAAETGLQSAAAFQLLLISEPAQNRKAPRPHEDLGAEDRKSIKVGRSGLLAQRVQHARHLIGVFLVVHFF